MADSAKCGRHAGRLSLRFNLPAFPAVSPRAYARHFCVLACLLAGERLNWDDVQLGPGPRTAALFRYFFQRHCCQAPATARAAIYGSMYTRN